MIYTLTERYSTMIGPCHQNYTNYDAECKGDYWFIENNKSSLVCEEQGGRILIQLYYHTPYGTFSFIKAIDLIIRYTKDQKWFFDQGYYFKALSLIQHNGHGRIDAFSDTINIGSKTFFSVYTLIQDEDPYGLQNLKTVYYNFSQGLVGFKSSDGHLWYLAN
jgi:hypothetical protein